MEAIYHFLFGSTAQLYCDPNRSKRNSSTSLIVKFARDGIEKGYEKIRVEYVQLSRCD